MESSKLIEFGKKPQTQSIWVRKDDTKPFENCTDMTQISKDVLAELEKDGYDEEDTERVHKFQVGDYWYRFNFWNGDWQCTRWKPGKPKTGGGSGWTKTPQGPREWSYVKMVDFEFGSLNHLHEIMMNSELADDESWELMPDIVMAGKDQPHAVMRKLKRITMIGSEEKASPSQNGKEDNS